MYKNVLSLPVAAAAVNVVIYSFSNIITVVLILGGNLYDVDMF